MKISFISVCIFFSVLMFSSLINAEEIIRLSAGEWKPYISKDFEHYGPFSQIVTEAFESEGIKVEYKFYPWKRAVYMAKKCSVDGSIAITNTPERKKIFWYSDEPVVVGERVFFHLKSYPFDWENINDLKDMRIGATLEYFYGDLFENAEKTKEIRVERVPSDVMNFKKLIAGRFNIFPVTREVGYYILKSEFDMEKVKLVTHHPKPLSSTPFYVILSKEIAKNEHMIKAFNKGLKHLKQSGRYDMIFENMIKNLDMPAIK